MHQICTPEGVPVSFDLRPAAEQDLTPIHELTFALPPGSSVFGDKGDVSDPDAETILTATGVCFVADRRRNMSPNSWADDFDLRHYPKRIETVFSPLEAMRIQHLHARTNQGFDLKASASLLAPAFTNFISV